MAIGANQKPLHELTALLGAQPAAYRGNTWGETSTRGVGLNRIRADRLAAGLHPIGVAPIDQEKDTARHGCADCQWRGEFKHNSARFSVCRILQQTGHRRGLLGGKRLAQVRLYDPPCVKHEQHELFGPGDRTTKPVRKKKGAKTDATPA